MGRAPMGETDMVETGVDMKGDIASIGECMVELAPAGGGLFQQGFAGDTLNTAWYLRALLPRETRKVRYVSAVGTDAISEAMLAFLADHGIDTGSIARLPDRTVGLYLITLDGAERSFSYWRSVSAARQLAADQARLAAALDGVAVAYLSGITLAILDPESRGRLFEVLSDLRRRGGAVVFDPNIRPRLWDSAATMAEVITRGYRASTIALPTFPDDAALYGDASPHETARRIADLGVREIAVKDGGNPALVWVDGNTTMVPPSQVARAIDTTGAGDSFNGGYLAARVAGRSPLEAARLGHDVAGRVICERGALAPMPLFTDLMVG